MPRLADTLELALSHFQQGNLPQAAQCCQQILASHPNQTDALQLLGLIAAQQGKTGVAIAYFQQLITIDPGCPGFHYNLAYALQSQGDNSAAISAYQQVLFLEPNHLPACYNLGELYLKTGQPAAAINPLQQAIHLKPDLVIAHYNLGNAYLDLGQSERAIACYQQVLTLKPDHREAIYNLGTAYQALGELESAIACYQQILTLKPGDADACNNLGSAYLDLGKLEMAIRYYRQALALRPDHFQACFNLAHALQVGGDVPEAIARFEMALQHQSASVDIQAEIHNRLGQLRQHQGDFSTALNCYQQALDLNPQLARAQVNLGSVLLTLGQPQAAIAAYQRAIHLEPQLVAAHNGLATAWLEQGNLDLALSGYEAACNLDPSDGETRFNRAIALLLSGDLELGFKEYEWRWQRPNIQPRPFAQPQWDGSPLGASPGGMLRDRTLLVYTEQGFGDALQFSRYLPLIAAQGGRVILECPLSLQRLFTTLLGVEQVISQGSVLPEFDVQIPLLSLPMVLGTTLATIPNRVPYLQVPEAVSDSGKLAEEKLAELNPGSNLNIGIVWASSASSPSSQKRSCPLELFLPLARSGMCLYSLQKEVTSSEAQLLRSAEIQDWGTSLTDFAETAYLIQQLDLVISVDTAVAHLAGALGKPVWVLLPFVPDWRWLMGRTDSPWYPTLRLFRQPRPGDWAAVLNQVKPALEYLCQGGQ